MGLTKEVVHREMAQNILKEEDVIKPTDPLKKSKAKPSRSAPLSEVKKLTPPPKPTPIVSTDAVEKRKKEKPSREYVAEEEEKKLDEEV